MGMRTYGLSGSGMDVDKMVQDLMKARRVTYDNMYKKKTQLEWKKTDYNTMYNEIKGLRDNTAFNYKLQGTTLNKKATSTNEAAVIASGNADAANVNHTMTVERLANGVTEGSSAKITTGADKSTLASQFLIGGDSFNLTISDGTSSKTITVDLHKSIYEFASSINLSGLNVKANYDANTDRFFLYSTNTGSDVAIDFSGSSAGGMDFVVNKLKLPMLSGIGQTGLTSTENVDIATGDALNSKFAGVPASFNLKLTNGTNSKVVTINGADTLQQMMDKIKDAGVDAEASFVNGKLTLKAKNGNLDLAGSDSAAVNLLVNQFKLPPKAVGQDAQVTLDGLSLTQTKNTFTVAGVTYNLKAAGTANVTVSPDNNKTIENVKAFVEAYNSTLGKINDELKETKYKNYLPLTSDEKKAMSESEIKDWEKLAKSGMLRRDSILQETVNKMRSDISTPIAGLSGKYTSLSSLGINTGVYTEGGKLYLDENKLKKALEEDPDIAYKLFGTSGETTSQQGVAVRLYDTLKNSMDKIKTEAGITASTDADTQSNLAKAIKDYNNRLDDLNDRLKEQEDRYYRQFDAMEAALNKMNQQSSWLSQQLGSK